jgi:hypothetical protein
MALLVVKCGNRLASDGKRTPEVFNDFFFGFYVFWTVDG